MSDGDIIGEIGEVIAGKVPGRGSGEDVTLFKSLGLAIEDLAAGHLVYRNARASGAGRPVAIGGLRRA